MTHCPRRDTPYCCQFGAMASHLQDSSLGTIHSLGCKHQTHVLSAWHQTIRGKFSALHKISPLTNICFIGIWNPTKKAPHFISKSLVHDFKYWNLLFTQENVYLKSIFHLLIKKMPWKNFLNKMKSITMKKENTMVYLYSPKLKKKRKRQTTAHWEV